MSRPDFTTDELAELAWLAAKAGDRPGFDHWVAQMLPGGGEVRESLADLTTEQLTELHDVHVGWRLEEFMVEGCPPDLPVRVLAERLAVLDRRRGWRVHNPSRPMPDTDAYREPLPWPSPSGDPT